MANPERIFLTWLPFSSRSETLARNFLAQPIYFGYLAGGKNLFRIGLRYALMTFHTMILVLFRRPKLVLVMNQPVFLPLTIYIMAKLLRFKYVVDSHSGLFNKAEWSWALPLMKSVYRHSLFSIVTNQEHRQLVESYGAKVEILGALTVGDEPVVAFNRSDKPCFVVIGTFAADEPLEEMMAACKQVLEAQFYVTGSLKKAPPELLSAAPANVIFTDFQPRANYIGLVQATDAAIILVKFDNVMQRGAYEAMSWGIPIITSDWQILRESFTRGTLFVDNTPQDIVRAIRELMAKKKDYKAEIIALREEKRLVWEDHIAKINTFIASHL
jgi:glycosyltransferase involved in cell wall biosynthesis